MTIIIQTRRDHASTVDNDRRYVPVIQMERNFTRGRWHMSRRHMMDNSRLRWLVYAAPVRC